MAVLIGRDAELQLLRTLLDGASASGSGLLLCGGPGVGKSALAEAAIGIARDRGFTVLSCAGVSSEAQLPLAGLHQLTRPILSAASELSAAERTALHVALGIARGPFPEKALLGMAVLALAEHVADRDPVLLVADDAHWLDTPTREILAFVSRRVPAGRVVVLVTTRDDDIAGNPLTAAGLDERELGPLGPEAAALLVGHHAADLDPTVRARILAEAGGNPLALIELPAAARILRPAATAPGSAPITWRLERAFAARLPHLSEQTRAVLLVAALADSGKLTEILAAATVAMGSRLSAADLEPAVAADLVRMSAGEVIFRHPLTRSAVRQAASTSERLTAHAALALVLHNEPARRAWHRSASTTGPDEDVASDLERLAAHAQEAGAPDIAAAAHARAAELGADPARRAERWLRAAEVAWQAALRERWAPLLRKAESARLSASQRARADYLRETAQGANRRSGTSPIAAFAAIADEMRLAGDIDRAIEALLLIAMRCYFSNPDAATRGAVVGAAEAIPAQDVSQRVPLTLVLALAAPIERGAVVIDRLSALRRAELSAVEEHWAGTAATAVGAYDLCGAFLEPAIDRLRAEGRINHLAQALHTWAWAGVNIGDPAISGPAAEEAHRLFSETSQDLWAACAQLAMAAEAGRRGDTDRAETLAAAAERILLFAGLGPLLAMVCLARGIAALGAGRHAEAYDSLLRVFDPGDPAHHPHLRAWALADMVEAALHSDHREDARKLCTDLSGVAAATGSPLMKAGLLVAAPQLADDDAAWPLFEAALKSDLTPWPLHRARVLLAAGSWLRRSQRIAESRVPLRAARDLFDSLGALPWSDRARQELSAAGERSLPRATGPLDVLSARELLIAQLAADGLTNREIGQKLYLSHRTVGSHLYRIFPKLGIASRAELAAATADRLRPVQPGSGCAPLPPR